MSSFRSLARNRDFTRLWVGEAVSQLGTGASLFVFPLLGYALTGSALMAGLPVAAYTLGIALVLLPAGVVADQVDRRTLLLAASAVGLVLSGSLAVAGLAGALTLPHLVVVALGTGAVAGFYMPTELSAVRSVVTREELPTAISQNQARHHVAALLGGPLGGLLYAVGRPMPFLVDAVTFAISFVTVARVETDLSPVPRERARPTRELVEGLRYLLARPYFRATAAFSAACNLVVNAVFFVAVVRLVEQGVPSTTIGVVEALAGAGGVIGALIAPFVIDRVRTGHLTMAVAWVWVPLLVPLVFWSSPWLVGSMLFVGLLLNPAGNAGAQSYRVAITPDALQGRIASSSQFLGFTTIPFAPLLGGWLLETFGGEAATVGLLVAAALAALVPTLSRSVRSVPRPRDWPGSAASAEPVEQVELHAPGVGTGIDDDEVVAVDLGEGRVGAGRGRRVDVPL
ncbi:MFS transporter [Nocardioides euryhalodurans]|uniref:MFS transporter n=1 Tax=Nocardioides euryhalodurans TaxID=2518370 RepID=UPI001ABDCF00|nr:MFS transporter [Nocardioides euryhalodurans]